jgi:DNA adenine methylase
MLLSMHGADEVREEYLRLPYAYPGSKAEDVKLILPHIPYGSGYGEPFGGTGAVLLNREPSKLEIWNDRYSGIVCFMRVVRDPLLFPRFMERTGEMSLHSREEFIWCKQTWENHQDEVERAARWYYAARFAINGKVQSTFGRSKDPKVRFSDRLIKSLPLFPAIHHRLRSVTLENMDWRQCLSDFDQKGFVWYLDPTYLDCFPGTYQHELSVADHKELALRIGSLHGHVVMSSFDGPQTLAIYDKPNLWDERIYWNRKTTMRTQAYTETNNLTESEHKGRDIVKEILWIRYAR